MHGAIFMAIWSGVILVVDAIFAGFTAILTDFAAIFMLFFLIFSHVAHHRLLKFIQQTDFGTDCRDAGGLHIDSLEGT